MAESAHTLAFSMALADVLAEGKRARDVHPGWPDEFPALAIVGEEFGELSRALVNYRLADGPREAVRHEALHLAATVLRFIEHLPVSLDPEDVAFLNSCSSPGAMSPTPEGRA